MPVVTFDGPEARKGPMAEKSPRRMMLEASLAEDPDDTFLRYGLAMQCLRDGDTREGRERLLALIADHPDDQIAAYQQLGQSYLDDGEASEALAILSTGIAKARSRGDMHAAAEMDGLLGLI
jgi:thioredoxin-like negative regulator of GroEL